MKKLFILCSLFTFSSCIDETKCDTEMLELQVKILDETSKEKDTLISNYEHILDSITKQPIKRAAAPPRPPKAPCCWPPPCICDTVKKK